MVGKIYLSVITVHCGYTDSEEIYIPFKVGQVLQGFKVAARLNKLLGEGHRFRGDVGMLKEVRND